MEVKELEFGLVHLLAQQRRLYSDKLVLVHVLDVGLSLQLTPAWMNEKLCLLWLDPDKRFFHFSTCNFPGISTEQKKIVLDANSYGSRWEAIHHFRDQEVAVCVSHHGDLRESISFCVMDCSNFSWRPCESLDEKDDFLIIPHEVTTDNVHAQQLPQYFTAVEGLSVSSGRMLASVLSDSGRLITLDLNPDENQDI